MERNPSDSTTGAGASTLGAGTDSISVTGQGADQSATGGQAQSSQQGQGQQLDDRMHQARDAATEKFGQAREMAGERLDQVKEKAGQLKGSLADRLEAGANSLRERAEQGGGPQLAGANGAPAGALADSQIQRLAVPAADAMQKTADFLRDGDLKEALEEQVRSNPARTLLIALGVGYLLGKAVRR